MDADKGEEPSIGELEGVEAEGELPPYADEPPLLSLATSQANAVSDVDPIPPSQGDDALVDANAPRPWRSEWKRLARRAEERRRKADRKRIERWTEAERQWLSAEKSF